MMAFVGFAGAAVTPLVTFTGYMLYRNKHPGEIYSMETLLSETSLYMVILIGTPLFGVLATWVFNREFAENTLRNILAIPVSRSALVVSKMIALFVWIEVLSAWSWLVAVVLGFAGGMWDGSSGVLVRYLAQFLVEGCWLFLLMTPIVFATLVLRNYVPVIIITVAITLVSVVIGNSEYQAVFPWTAILTVVTKKFPAEYPRAVPYVSIIGTSIAGFVASLAYFRRMDVA